MLDGRPRTRCLMADAPSERAGRALAHFRDERIRSVRSRSLTPRRTIRGESPLLRLRNVKHTRSSFKLFWR